MNIEEDRKVIFNKLININPIMDGELLKVAIVIRLNPIGAEGPLPILLTANIKCFYQKSLKKNIKKDIII